MTLSRFAMILLALCWLVGCSSSSDPKPTGTPSESETPASVVRELQGDEHLQLADFKVTMNHRGETLTITGDAQGKLSIADGDEVESLQVTADGHLTGEALGDSTCVMGADGVLLLDGKPSPMKITKEGHVRVNGQLFFRREGSRYVKVQARGADIEFDVEGPPEAKRVIGYLVALSAYMLVDEAVGTSPE